MSLFKDITDELEQAVNDIEVEQTEEEEDLFAILSEGDDVEVDQDLLNSMLEEEDNGAKIPIPKLKELPKAELLAMEKETTGIYLSGHPMDDYRPFLRNTHEWMITAHSYAIPM